MNDILLQATVVLGLDLATVQLLLLAVELVLLLATIFLLLLNRREAKSRETMMQHFSSVADVITRQEYFVAVVDAIQRAERTLAGSVTGSPPSKEEGEVVRQILGAVAEAAKRKVQVRYLLPLAPDRLRMGRLYTANGAEVKFNPSLLVSDVRYMCVDKKLVLIGVPERNGRNEPTRKGYTVPSESVAHLFGSQFEEQWVSKDTKSYLEYLKELVSQAMGSNSNLSLDLVAANLGVEKEDVTAALGRTMASDSH
ncbi:MAG: hypothetical protein OK436_01320 [Thaumarchaeota archaeon]|nr:hypothetical protein [Nitrososphaerota archaeon]